MAKFGRLSNNNVVSNDFILDVVFRTNDDNYSRIYGVDEAVAVEAESTRISRIPLYRQR